MGLKREPGVSGDAKVPARKTREGRHSSRSSSKKKAAESDGLFFLFFRLPTSSPSSGLKRPKTRVFTAAGFSAEDVGASRGAGDEWGGWWRSGNSAGGGQDWSWRGGGRVEGV
uniref:Uncharacterized protein n=1 Tax=Bursaphelenchus xylophilus TaxID=6326 RepID=A0A1I7SGW6_BURXY